MSSVIERVNQMASSEAYLGAFQSSDEVRVFIDKATIEILLSGMHMEDREITTEQWKKIWKGIYESDIVSDFFEGVIEITDQVMEDN